MRAALERCVICRGYASAPKYRLCWHCWESIGSPSNKEELLRELEKRPNLLAAIDRRERPWAYRQHEDGYR